jgi:hypothetical protein
MATQDAPSEQDYSDSGVVYDEMIASAEAAARGSTNLFDLRTIIGGLFTLYGVVLILLGIFDSPAEIAKAAGVRINLWTGLGMLALGVAFLLWMYLRPLRTEEIAEAVAAEHEEEAPRAAAEGA